MDLLVGAGCKPGYVMVMRVYLLMFYFQKRWDNVLSMAWKRSVLAPVLFSISVFVMIRMMQKGAYLLSLQMT